MFRRMRCLVGGLDPVRPLPRILSSGSRSSSSTRRRRRSVEFRQPDMLETRHEIAIYIHRFHNLDLFQQGWYQIKVSLKWEDRGREKRGIPSRVVQYEAPDLSSDDVCGVWKINDSEQSFSTQPFKIKYARQDVLLSVMVSFNLYLKRDEKPSTSAVLLKFELMYAPVLETSADMQACLDSFPAAIHEFRIPPKALLGLHSYCPVHFDAFHAVLVDLSIHTTLLKAGFHTPPEKVPSKNLMVENGVEERSEEPNEILGQGNGSKAIELVKSLLISRELLLEELEKMSSAIGQTVSELAGVDLTIGRFELTCPSRTDSSNAGRSFSGKKKGVEQLTGMLNNILEKSNGTVEVGNDVVLYSLSKEEILDVFHSVGSQLSFIWDTFLKFHRINKMKILEYLYDAWAIDRKAEWSVWMIHSKIEIPHHYLRSGEAEDSSQRNALGKVFLRKSSDDQAQNAITRTELHRKSIAQMNFNNCSIQDMHIYSDPSRVPVVLIEKHIMDVPLHGSGNNLSVHTLDQNASAELSTGHGDKAVPNSKSNGRMLKAVVFVHGFQGHHLDLRLVRNQWLLMDPGVECLMSEVNEEKTSGDFREMGSRLAEEVTTFLRKKIDKLSKYGGCKDIKLSFVGHSIGNVIIRTALTESLMAPYLKKLHTYVSLSGPHLGYCYSSNSLFNSGLWLLKKLKGAQCIHQLTFSDDPDLQNTFFYKLCKQRTLDNFKNIILLSSPQDGYVPYHSARIEVCQASTLDQSKKAQVFVEMLNSCLDQIRASSSEQRTFMRCDVNFDQSAQGKNLNTFIGRAAHIEFLETDLFIRFIMWSFPELFR